MIVVFIAINSPYIVPEINRAQRHFVNLIFPLSQRTITMLFDILTLHENGYNILPPKPCPV